MEKAHTIKKRRDCVAGHRGLDLIQLVFEIGMPFIFNNPHIGQIGQFMTIPIITQ